MLTSILFTLLIVVIWCLQTNHKKRSIVFTIKTIGLTGICIKMSINSNVAYKEHFDKYGYVVLSNVFKDNEINDLRNEIKLHENDLKKNVSKTKSSLKMF